MKTKALKIVNFIVAAIVALFAVGQAFAWLVDTASYNPEFGGSSSQGYYAGGSGTQDDPYIINRPVHLYNLAWLQNNGFYDSGIYYFELDENLSSALDMQAGTTKYIIPPIGNAAYPFRGVFNGNGKTISNLKVSTNKNVLTVSASTNLTEYEFSNYVGFFGATAEDSSITNFILSNPTVEIADEKENSFVDTKYASGEVASDKLRAAGLAVGQVNGLVQSIGVNKGTLLARKAGYTTYNSILGELGTDIDSSVTGGGKPAEGNGGSGAAFGASFDIASMVERLNDIYKGKYGVEYAKGNKDEPLADASVKLPTVDTQNSTPTPGEGAQLAFTADVANSTYTGPDAQEGIAEQNVGYFLGNQNKFDTKQFTFIDRMTDPNSGWLDWRDSNGVTSTNVPAWFYTFDEYISNNDGTGCKSAQGFRELTDDEFADLPANVKKLLPEIGSQKTFTTIRISQDGVSTMNYGNTQKTQWSYHGQINWMGKTYGKGFRSNANLPVDENGNVLTDCNDQYGNQLVYSAYTNGVALPNSAIWFKPAQVGKFRFIMYSQSDGDGFTLDKIVRTNADKDNPFYVDTDFSVHGSDVEATTIIKQRLATGILFYYEYNVKAEEIEAGNIEFILQKNGTGGAHFIYLDIGSSAAADISGVAPGKVSAIDFVYDGVSINQNAIGDLPAGNFVVGSDKYEATQASVYFELAADYNGVLALYFVRGTASPYSLTVTASDGNGGGKDSVKTSGNGAGGVTVNNGTITPMYFS